MVDTAVLAGPAIRRLRRRQGLTQTAMAAQLGISPSYLNLVERNQRPLSAKLLVRLAEAFDFDPRSLRQDEVVGGVDGLRRRLADARFADLAIDRDELAEWLSAAPQAAIAFARLFDAGTGAAVSTADEPMELVRRVLTGTGDCGTVDWTLFGLSMPVWSLIGFVLLAAWGLFAAFRKRRSRHRL